VVFPLSKRYFRRDPDEVLTEEFLPWVVEVPVWTDEEIRVRHGEDWRIGESKVGRSHPVLDKLCVAGFLERAETERQVLIGEDARRHFRRFDKDDFRRQEYEYTAKISLSSEQLLSVGLSGLDDREWKKSFQESGTTIQMSFRTPYRDADATSDILDTGSLGLEDFY